MVGFQQSHRHAVLPVLLSKRQNQGTCALENVMIDDRNQYVFEST
jgi:hypothetical protein